MASMAIVDFMSITTSYLKFHLFSPLLVILYSYVHTLLE